MRHDSDGTGTRLEYVLAPSDKRSQCTQAIIGSRTMNEQQPADNEQQPVSDDHQSAGEEVHHSSEEQSSAGSLAWAGGLGVILFVVLKFIVASAEQSPDVPTTYSAQSAATPISGYQGGGRSSVNSQVLGYQSADETQAEQQDDSDPTGLYVYRNFEGETRLVVAGMRWLARTIIKTGFGAEYDASQGMTSVGVVSGNILYDETGYVEVGSLRRIGRDVWVAELAFGAGTMRLRKQ